MPLLQAVGALVGALHGGVHLAHALAALPQHERETLFATSQVGMDATMRLARLFLVDHAAGNAASVAARRLLANDEYLMGALRASPEFARANPHAQYAQIAALQDARRAHLAQLVAADAHATSVYATVQTIVADMGKAANLLVLDVDRARLANLMATVNGAVPPGCRAPPALPR